MLDCTKKTKAVELTPDEFLFAVKASRYLTHAKRLREIAEGVKRMNDGSAR